LPVAIRACSVRRVPNSNHFLPARAPIAFPQEGRHDISEISGKKIDCGSLPTIAPVSAFNESTPIARIFPQQIQDYFCETIAQPPGISRFSE